MFADIAYRNIVGGDWFGEQGGIGSVEGVVGGDDGCGDMVDGGEEAVGVVGEGHCWLEVVD